MPGIAGYAKTLSFAAWNWASVRMPLIFIWCSFSISSTTPLLVPPRWLSGSTTPPTTLVAAWIALEDVDSDLAGPLVYVPSSHRLNYCVLNTTRDILFTDARVPESEKRAHIDHLNEAIDAQGLSRKRFKARKGDVLFWDSGLVHGGAPLPPAAASAAEPVTRHSLVVHFDALARRATQSIGLTNGERHESRRLAARGCAFTAKGWCGCMHDAKQPRQSSVDASGHTRQR